MITKVYKVVLKGFSRSLCTKQLSFFQSDPNHFNEAQQQKLKQEERETIQVSLILPKIFLNPQYVVKDIYVKEGQDLKQQKELLEINFKKLLLINKFRGLDCQYPVKITKVNVSPGSSYSGGHKAFEVSIKRKDISTKLGKQQIEKMKTEGIVMQFNFVDGFLEDVLENYLLELLCTFIFVVLCYNYFPLLLFV